jgi:deoxyadenosine/deoxycytidine kinase
MGNLTIEVFSLKIILMKISFSGTPKSGKSSLLEEVKKILSLKYNVEAVDEISSKNPFDDDKKSEFRSQFFYMTTQVNEENIKSIAAPDILLCDRSVLDQWIYWQKHIKNQNMTPSLGDKSKILENIYQFWMKTYDLVFLIRLDNREYEKRNSGNEFRKVTTEYMKETESLFSQAIEDYNLKVHEIWNNNSLDESAQNIIQIISEKMELDQT